MATKNIYWHPKVLCSGWRVVSRARLLFALFGLLFFMNNMAGVVYAQMKVHVDHAQREQGQFFTVTVDGVPSEPTLNVMGRSLRMFRHSGSLWRAFVPVENTTPPGKYRLSFREGEEEQRFEVTVTPNNRPIQKIQLDSSKTGLHATEIEKSRVKRALHTETPEQLFQGVFRRPVSGRTCSLFGLQRSYNGGPVEGYHKGIDISASQGTPVRCTAHGKVVLTGAVENGFLVHGNTVIIDHGQGVVSVYLHLSAIAVHEGQSVEAGEILGNAGHTGISTAPHLHWGLYLYGTSVDPELFEGFEL